MKCLKVIIVFSLFSVPCFTQTKVFDLTLKMGNTITRISIDQLQDDSVEISRSGESQWILVDSILVIKEIRKSKFWKGAGLGFLGGAVLGGVIATVTYNDTDSSSDSFDFDFSGLNTVGGIILGGVGGGVIGGIAGASSGRDIVYDLSQKNLEEKLQIIKSILSKQKNN